jgi:hypothetical protein
MSDEADRRIEAAREEAQRAKDTNEFLNSLTKNDEFVKPIYNPEAWVIRDKARAAASRGEMPRSQCTHPFQAMQQYVDEDPARERNGRPLNLFECGVCHLTMWIVDPWGVPISDR